MAIGSGLRDRARVVKSQKTTVRVNGAFQHKEVYGPWFRCLFDPGGEGEGRTGPGVRRAHTGAQLLTGRRALDGTAIELEGSDRVEIDSRRYGTLQMDVAGTPEKIVKRTSQIGWLAPLQKVDRKSASA